MDKRFIEESFPVMEVSEESAKEKSIRHGHISTLHVWWARRPLASSRGTAYAALIPAPENKEELEKQRNFIIELSKWENSSNHNLIEKARKEILAANDGIAPRVLDPFSGGGSIPLEALRLGCETYANDYNPVAILIEKCSIEYPQKYGIHRDGILAENKNSLAEDVKKLGKLVLKEAEKELGRFYPKEKDSSIPIGYIWARTITCQNPTCNAEIPLIRQFWLAKKCNKEVALKPFIKNGKIEFKIVGQDNNIPNDFDPSKGTISKAIAKCLVCGSVIEAKKTRSLFQEGKSGERMIAVISYHPKKRGKIYRVANEQDIKIFEDAEKHFQLKRQEFIEKWGIDPVPDEPTPKGKGRGAERAFSVRNYGLDTWGDLFNSRQKLTLITFIEKINEISTRTAANLDDDYVKVLKTYLALGIDRLVDFGSSLCVLNPTGGRGVVHTFGRQVLPIVFDYAESNPFNPTGAGWITACNKNEKWIENASIINNNSINVNQSSATSLPYPDGFFDAIFTDPPYYDNVPYSYLSDFFYVWLKRSIGDLYPELFITPLTPKKDEIVVYTYGKSIDEAKLFFEDMLAESFKEIYRVLKPNGITTIVYAHKTTEGWETVINSLLDSGLTVTSSWPLSTEMKGRLRAQNSATLASSIYIVARKYKKQDIGWYNEVKDEIKTYIPQKLDRLWKEGISGADFFVAAIGSAIEVFGKYEKVIDFEGKEIRANILLTFVRDVVTDYAVRHILHNGIADELSPLTKFYLLWRWNYQEATVPFDEARKLAQSAGIDLANEWNKGFITKKGSIISVEGPEKRKIDDLENSRELIDVLHYALNLWNNGEKEKIKDILTSSGLINREAFYKVAQAISETLPSKSKEKGLIDGFLSGRKITDDINVGTIQTKLDGVGK